MSATVVVFVVCVAACVVAHAAILLSSISARTATAASATPAVPRPRAVSEFLWALVPILALALVFTATWARVREREAHPPATMKVVQ